MQVKKFEAKNMAEALKMVKSELGPEAIILSAKDNKRGYGIAGGTSVELTAAISETKYRERQFALAKLKEEEKRKMLESSAKTQKKFIDKSMRNYLDAQSATPKPIPNRPRYIQIDDEEVEELRQSTEVNNTFESAGERVRNATKSAFNAFDKDFSEPILAQRAIVKKIKETKEVANLKQEIARLQEVVNSFQKLPQTFVGSHPGSEYGLPYDLTFIFEKLTEAGVNKEILVGILNTAKKHMTPIQIKKKALVEAWVAKHFLDTIRVCGDSQSHKLEVFVGGCGSGKTSSLIKYASHQLIVNRKSVAIITTDNYKVGAAEQLKIFAQILNVPFAVVKNNEELDMVLSKLSNTESILIDTPGVNLKDLNEIDLLKSKVSSVLDRARLHYVASTTNAEANALELARRFKMFNYHDLICTKLDECSGHGIIYTLSEKLNCPLHSFGIGTNIPEDFEFATRERLLDLIFKITKNKGQ